MSHNVKLKDTSFTNLGYVRRAVAELAKEGAKVSFVEGSEAIMRGAYGSRLPMDAIIKIDGGPWDVGLKYNAETKQYDINVESDMGRSQAHGGLGSTSDAKMIEGAFCHSDHQSRMIGRLTQRYNLIRDEVMANQKGMITRRLPGKNGQMILEAEMR